MTVETTRWDPAEYPRSDEAIAEYLTAALEDGDPKLVAACLGDIARARGMTRIARDSGLTREQLYRALRPEGNPELATVLCVAKALGIRFVAESANREDAA